MSEMNEELVLLKERADLMGIKYSGNIGIDALKAKINERLEDKAIAKEEETIKVDTRASARAEQLKLVRIRLNCMNPNKSALRGEVFSIANSVIGSVKKFVPFDPKFYVNGYHVPYCIYTMLKEKVFLSIKTEDKGAKTTVTTALIPEFAIEILPELTEAELKQLATEQAAGNRIDLADE